MAILPKVKLKVIPVFPTDVTGGNAIDVTKENGAYTIDLNVSDIQVASVAAADTATVYAISWGYVTEDNPDGSFRLVPYSGIQGSSDDLTDLADLGTTGLVARIGDADYTTRTITAGTGIGVTNGDGVAGNPTVAITDAELMALAGLTSAADKVPYFTGVGTAALADFSAFARTLVDDADASASRSTLGLVIGTNVQAFDADLSALAANSTDGFWAHTGAGTGAARTLTGPAAGLSITNPAGIAGNPTFALANDLAALEGLSGTNTIYYRSAADTWTAVTIGTGLTFSGGSLAATAGSSVVSVKKQVFTASGTYTPSTGMLYCIIECVGGGGGGGSASGTSAQSYGGGGGGSGGYSRLVATAATIGASQVVTIGAGGGGGASGSNNGSAGSDTSVGSICIGKGGSPGNFGSSSQVGSSGAGGVAGTGDLVATGTSGTPGLFSNSSSIVFASGAGGSSYFGGGGKGVHVAGAATAGTAGGNYGGGGAGAQAHNTASSAAGGNGSAGVVFVTEFVAV